MFIGRGVFASEPIEEGAFILEYRVELLSVQDCQKKKKSTQKLKAPSCLNLSGKVIAGGKYEIISINIFQTCFFLRSGLWGSAGAYSISINHHAGHTF